MEDLTEKLNQVLNDPAQMSQIFELAKQLGGTAPQPEEPSATLPVAPEQLQRILSMLNCAGGKEEELLRALGPFLSPEKAQKLSKAVQAARMSKIITRVLHEQRAG